MKRKLLKAKSSIGAIADKAQEPNWDKETVVLSLKYFQHDKECFSNWRKQELSKFWDFNRRLHQMTWQDVFATASKGAQKRGVAYTVIPRCKYKGVAFIRDMSNDITMFELRVDGVMRVHGFREKQLFHLCLLDRSHSICSD
jgi:hypothetical protein